MTTEIQKTTAQIDAEYQAQLEDDAGMRTITPMEKIDKRLKKLFGEDLFNKWKQENQP